MKSETLGTCVHAENVAYVRRSMKMEKAIDKPQYWEERMGQKGKFLQELHAFLLLGGHLYTLYARCSIVIPLADIYSDME